MTDKKSKGDEVIEPPVTVNLGEVLSRARKDKGLSVEEISFHLGVTLRTVEALEKEEYERLPSALYVKGYIKRYCSIVDIPDGELLTAFDDRANELSPSQGDLSLRLYGARRKKAWNWAFIFIAVVIVVAAFIAWLIFFPVSDQGDESAPLQFEQSAAEQGGEGSAMQWSPAQPLSNSMDAGGDMQSDGADEPYQTSVAKTDSPETVASEPVIQVLGIKVVQQSWIEVFDANGDVLLADLKSPGFQGSVSGVGPFDVILGYAAGVELSLNGQPVDVPVNVNKDGTAKLNIGREKQE